MTDDLVDMEEFISEAFEHVRQNTSIAAVPILDALERLYAIERMQVQVERAKVSMTGGVTGHRVYGDNDQHSRRATDLRSVS